MSACVGAMSLSRSRERHRKKLRARLSERTDDDGGDDDDDVDDYDDGDREWLAVSESVRVRSELFLISLDAKSQCGWENHVGFDH